MILKNCLPVLKKKEEDHPLTLAIDFDGTIAEYHSGYILEETEPREGAKEALDSLWDSGYRLVIWTARDDLADVADWLDDYRIPYDEINNNTFQPTDSRKITADLYIDDRGLDANVSWEQITEQVEERLGKKQKKKPRVRHVILTGPSGVGKTFTSKLLSKTTGYPVWKVDKDELWMGSEDIVDHPERYEPGTKAYRRYRKLLKRLVRRALRRKTPSILEGCQFLVAPGTLRGHHIVVLDADEGTVVRQRLQRDAIEGKLQREGYNARREKAEELYRQLRPSIDFMKTLPDVEVVTPSRIVEWVNSFQRRGYKKDAPKNGGWITLDPSGTHVFIENGNIIAGPASMTGKPLNKLPKTEPKEPEAKPEPPKQKPPNPSNLDEKKEEQNKFKIRGSELLHAAGLHDDAERVASKGLLPNTEEGRQILRDLANSTEFSQYIQDTINKVFDLNPIQDEEDEEEDSEDSEEEEYSEDSEPESDEATETEPEDEDAGTGDETINTQGIQPPDHLVNQSKKYLATIDTDQKSALKDYTGSGYSHLNKQMRKCPPNYECVEGTYERNMMNQLEKTIAESPDFEEPVDVYRGMKLSHEVATKLLAEVQNCIDTGKEFSMPSITSTTIKPGVAIGTFAATGSYQKPVVFKIKAKSGVYVESMTSISGEFEVIQSGKTRYRPVKIVDTNYEHPSYNTKTISTIYLEEVEWKSKTTKSHKRTKSLVAMMKKPTLFSTGSKSSNKARKNDFAGIAPDNQPGPANGILGTLPQRMNDRSGEGLGGRLLEIVDDRTTQNEWADGYGRLKSVLGTLGNQGVPSERLDPPTRQYLVNPGRILSMADSAPGLEGLTIERSEMKCPCGLKSKLGKGR